ncbi:sigma 54-interacting transcriptional regulator [Enterococcus sp. ALS3]|uniref:Sigma 54-interacting transcriptional regulator n=1 Tax=Enterococcus alishanensis TaxID=1303817 RepID=A0ABS6TGM8_9ENTE|nr:sigma 54-interacting transcriptional regulator [Enterococcus alishanensis]MBV7392061.1 sigma 54-interacting transcriptional regulator [Enterococcus alishanensis]
MRSETKEQLLDVLKQQEKLTTTEIAEKIQLSRSATSLYLNELLQTNEVTKLGSKPVYWQLLGDDLSGEDVFSKYIGSHGSAKKEIEKCKSAVLYPPLGLPVLLHGASGVGKSFLAELIFDYLHQQNLAGAEKFLVFNCADYANNPELVASLLFGHTKGAFTGAEADKKGLLAQADNGVLFLDEVHRLSDENQEKLFLFMDSHKFRPIGEEEKTETSNVRLLFATTEDPEKVLLPTFYRRISVLIDLPSFHERPLFERNQLVYALFLREAKRIKKNIRINHRIFDELMNEQLPGNVGSLANQVQMYCAEALRTSQSQETILIGEDDGQTVWIDYQVTEEKVDDLAQQDLINHFQEILSEAVSLSEKKQRLFQFDHDYLADNFVSDSLAIGLIQEVQTQNRLIIDDEELTFAAINTIARILQLYQQTISAEILQNLSYQLSKEYPRTLLLANYLTKSVTQELQSFVKVILAVLLTEDVSEEIRYQGLLVAHGNTTASSIQAVVNRMCGEYIFDAINMPLTASLRDVVAQVKLWLGERNTSEGVIMLVDMGSLTQLYKSLKPQILGELLVINNLTTSYALEIGQKLLHGELFYEIAKTAEENFVTEVQYFEGFSVEKNIIIASISGRDVSKKIMEICQKYVNQDIKLIVLGYNELAKILDRAYLEKDYLKETSLILTTSYLDNKTDVASFNILDVLDENAEEQLNQNFKDLIHPSNIPMVINEFIYFFSKEGLSEKLVFLNPDVIIKQVEDIIDKFEKRFKLQVRAKMKFNLMMHIALMTERIILGTEDYAVPQELAPLKINDKSFYQNAKDIFSTIEQFYKIKVSDWELYVLYEILTA